MSVGGGTEFVGGSSGHNRDAYKAWVVSQGGRYTETPTDTPGIYLVHGEIPRDDNPDRFRQLEPKTVYDPVYYSDARMNEMARDAGAVAWDRYTAGDIAGDDARRAMVYFVQVDGVSFVVYLNAESGTGRVIVGNAHPVGR